MFCPNCGTYTDGTRCLRCGMELQGIVLPKTAAGERKTRYDTYRRFYPNKIEAIQALRIDTGMNAVEAKRIIDHLFGADVMPEKPVFPHSPGWKATGQTQPAHQPDFVEVDVAYYANRHYPSQKEAVRALCRLGVGEEDARIAIAEAFREIESSREQERREKMQKTAKTVGKGIGLAALFGGYGALHIVSKLTGQYMGSSKRHRSKRRKW